MGQKKGEETEKYSDQGLTVHTGQELTLLLVEDNADDAQYIERLIRTYQDHESKQITITDIDRARDLETALDLLEPSPDIVLLDLGLPDSDGLSTVEAIVTHAPDVPVVVVTGYQETDLGPQAIKKGAQDYLQKGRITDVLLHRTVRYAIDRHHKQREIIELNQRLSMLNRIIRQDIRDDISVIIGRANTLQDHIDPGEEPILASLLDAADRSLERTAKADELAAVLSEAETGTLEPVDLTTLLENCVERLRDRNDAVEQVVFKNSTEQAVSVEATPMLESALEELLENAVQHNNNEQPTVTVELTEGDGDVSIIIADDGVGIPDVQQQRLNAFETRHGEAAGIGTGLYFVLSVVEQSGGSISFTDNNPSGTRVTVTLDRING